MENFPDLSIIFYLSSPCRKPGYYQEIAINKTLEAISKGENRVLPVMATGTGNL